MGKRMNRQQWFAYNNYIQEFVHFTNEKNLISILKRGVLSRKDLLEKHIPFEYNDEKRLDGMLDAISLSVTSPNYKMFYKYRMLKEKENWIVITFDSQKILEFPCVFFRVNAGCRDSLQFEKEECQDAAAFEEMFSDWDLYHDRRSLKLSNNEPTNPQAEVMVLKEIPISCIDRIVFQTEGQYKAYLPILDKYEIKGMCGAHFFAPRHDYAYWNKLAA